MEWWQYLITMVATLIFTTIVWLIGNVIENKK